MARTDTLTHFLTDVADAIRTKTGESGTIQASSFDTAIGNIPSGGGSDEVVIDLSKGNYNSNAGIKSYITSVNLDLTGKTDLSSFFKYGMNLSLVVLTNTNSATTAKEMFYNCVSLTTIPQFNTSKVGNFASMFFGCTNLTTVPILDASNIKNTNNMTNMFANCPNLTDTSLDNILQMCIGATQFTGTKQLATLGFTSTNYPASRIQALPHYQDFVNAGWTIGY